MTEEPFRPLVRTQSDLERMWRRLMSPLGFSSHTLWMVVIEDDRPVPQVIEIVEAADAPGQEDAVAFARVLEHLAQPGPALRVPALATRRRSTRHHRPGLGAGAARRRDVASAAAIDVVHLAHDHDVLPIALDDLLAEPA